MLRPSDVAPKAVHFDPVTMLTYSFGFTTDQVVFEQDGSLHITFHGIKNDTDRSGFEVVLPPGTNPILDPVKTLADYLRHTNQVRRVHNSSVFISLYQPYNAISAATVASILDESITQAGLSRELYSAKSFRPTGATVAVNKQHNPKTVMKVGRWKTESVFYDHYVHSTTPLSFTDDILNS